MNWQDAVSESKHGLAVAFTNKNAGVRLADRNGTVVGIDRESEKPYTLARPDVIIARGTFIPFEKAEKTQLLNALVTYSGFTVSGNQISPTSGEKEFDLDEEENYEDDEESLELEEDPALFPNLSACIEQCRKQRRKILSAVSALDETFAEPDYKDKLDSIMEMLKRLRDLV